MSLVRRALPFCLAVVALAAPAQAAAKPKPAVPKAPQGVHGFLLRADEPAADTFPRTPSFAWAPVPGALRYEFELSTSSTFSESGLVWSGSVSGTPAISVPLALPWMTGYPYALYAHVRAVTKSRTSSWSQSFGFNMRAPDAPLQEDSYPGLVRWSTVEGATSYQVWWTDIGKQISSLTNAADERELYTFHQLDPWPSVVRYRVRAVRSVYGSLPNGLPVVAYGPWSPTYVALNTPFVIGFLSLGSTVSETVDPLFDSTKPHTHTPAFLFSGSDSLSGLTSELYRVYVFTDKDCVNLVFRGAVVGSPAYSPRPSGPLGLPGNSDDLAKARAGYLKDGSEGTTLMADLAPVTTSEAPTSSTTPSNPPSAGAQVGLVDLWDSGWPTGRYYWTVVPVDIVSNAETKGLSYRDAELPQEACAEGRVASFGKLSDPVVIAEHATASYKVDTPYASGLSPDGHLVSASKAKPTFYGTPLVAWRPALGAAQYEVQWSKKLYPWSTEGKPLLTDGTSTLLQSDGGKPLAPGTWYYRVRGLDPYIPGAVTQMSWSQPVQIAVAKPQFKVVGKVAVPKKNGQSYRTWVQSGFAVSIPASWPGVDRSTASGALKSNPRARVYLASALKELASGRTGLTFLAYDPNETDISTIISVSAITSASDHTHAQWVQAAKQVITARKDLAVAPRCADVKVPAGPALRCSYAYRIGKTKFLESETSYWFDRKAKTYVLQLQNLRGQDKAKAPLFANVLSSFRLTS